MSYHREDLVILIFNDIATPMSLSTTCLPRWLAWQKIVGIARMLVIAHGMQDRHAAVKLDTTSVEQTNSWASTAQPRWTRNLDVAKRKPRKG
jgi:hypothetical protein